MNKTVILILVDANMMLGYLSMLRSQMFLRTNFRNISSFFPLTNRELISLRGCATIDFLQGLMTNDARLLEPVNSILYSLFLNIRVNNYLCAEILQRFGAVLISTVYLMFIYNYIYIWCRETVLR